MRDAPSELGARLTTWLKTSGRCDSNTILHQEAQLRADFIYEREAAKIDAE